MEYSDDGGDSDKAYGAMVPRPSVEHAHPGAGAPPHASDPQYDMTGASYEALFLDGGLFSHFVNDEDEFGDADDPWPMYEDENEDTGCGTDAARPAGDAGHPVRLLPLDEAVAALLATCPRMASHKPASLALERAPMVYVIRRHMRTGGSVDFAPNGGGLVCASLAEACQRVEGLGPVTMLERGVVAWLAGRLMERVRPGSSQGVPVGPMSRIGALVQTEFGDDWTLSHPDQIDARFDGHEKLRLLLAWMVDSARVVARVRDGVSTAVDAVPHRSPNGKDYAFGPLRRLKSDHEAYTTCDPRDAEAWAAFLAQGKPTKRGAQAAAPRGRTLSGRGRRTLARSLPAPRAAPVPLGARSLATPSLGVPLPASSSQADKPPHAQTISGARASPQALPLSTGPVPPPNRILAPPPPLPLPTGPTPPPPTPAATQVIAPTALDATALDRAILAQVQSIALMTLSATDPATLASGAHVAFMAPSITCPGAMAFTCWVELPPGIDGMGGAAPLPAPPGPKEARPRKRPRVARQPRRTKATAAAGRSSDAPCAESKGDIAHSETIVTTQSTETAPPPAPASCTTMSAATTTTTTTTTPDAGLGAHGAGACIPQLHPLESHSAPAFDNSAPNGPPEVQPSASTAPQSDDGRHCAVRDTMIDCAVDQTRDTHQMQLDEDHPLSSSAPATDMHSSKPTETDLERLLAEPGHDEWDELLAGGRVSCG
ncbi:OxoGdeHyase C incomplete domain containing protein [Pandoravirus neocaledonia]|uniref:OxoGdeHyase C incomplete domain containing protein n=1 Tax=Pandoravirus neocaledonia TaxID=2107708 RepID=A0A2U7UDL3_9VIRU|nr:OxoGdeHyase C incomplete domain containing protein [Pandoravirus neocaledonia]AVK76516.1 OxoGdeHyase C incomplete domain containing protein [Pandoravirus neocaledonia]